VAGQTVRATRVGVGAVARSRLPSGQLRAPGRAFTDDPRPTLAEVGSMPLDFATDRTDLPCQQPGVDPEVFFPVGAHRQVGGSDDLDAEVEFAQAFCDRCPVQRACLRYALADRSVRYGVWGGVRFDGMHANTRTSLLKQLRQWERSA